MKFTDQSTGSPKQWNWSFGDGTWFNTTVSSLKSPANIYTTLGTYTARLTACNAAGCNTTSPGKTITVNLRRLPTAGFSTNVTSGTAPLAVKFTDTSIGLSLNKWNWSFGDGTWYNTTVAAQKNPVHVYSTQGSYTSRLTVSNSSGSNTTAQGTVITVTEPGPTVYKVYAEAGDSGTGIYDMAYGFWNALKGSNQDGSVTWVDWQSSSNIIDYSTARESHWTSNANQWVERGDFAYFSGHGSPYAFCFTYADESSGLYYADASRIRLGTGRTKWAVIDSCYSLNDASWSEWQQSFTGLHMLLGWNTSTVPSYDPVKSRGQVFAELMKGGYLPNQSQRLKNIDAWEWAGKYTWGQQPTSSDSDIWNAVIYDTNCRDDHLPGWGDFCIIMSGSQSYQSTLIFKEHREGSASTRSLNLAVDKYSVAASVPVTSDTAITYVPAKSGYTKEWVSSFAKNLGMSGNIRETEDAFYASDSDEQQYYFVVRKDTSMISFQKFDGRSGLPQSKEQSIAAASAFLRENNLLPLDSLEPEVVNNVGESIIASGVRHVDWKTNVISYPQMIDGLPVYNAQFTVEVDSNNNIIGLFRNWRDYKPSKKITLKSPEEAFSELQTRQPKSKTIIPEKIYITGVSLGYSLQLSEDGEVYLQPVYIFEGNNQRGNSSEPFEPVVIDAKKGEVSQNIISPTPTLTRKIVLTDNTTRNSTTVNTTVTATQNITIPSISSTLQPTPDQNEQIRNELTNNIGNQTNSSILVDNSTVLMNNTTNNEIISGNETIDTVSGG